MNVYAEHLDDDDLERYALHQLNGGEVGALENHLLLCQAGRVRLAAIEE